MSTTFADASHSTWYPLQWVNHNVKSASCFSRQYEWHRITFALLPAVVRKTKKATLKGQRDISAIFTFPKNVAVPSLGKGNQKEEKGEGVEIVELSTKTNLRVLRDHGTLQQNDFSQRYSRTISFLTCSVNVERDAVGELDVAVGGRRTVLLLGPLDQALALVITQSLHRHADRLHQRLFRVHFLISLRTKKQNNSHSSTLPYNSTLDQARVRQKCGDTRRMEQIQVWKKKAEQCRSKHNFFLCNSLSNKSSPSHISWRPVFRENICRLSPRELAAVLRPLGMDCNTKTLRPIQFHQTSSAHYKFNFHSLSSEWPPGDDQN